jgi:hypothetical protein
MKQLPNKQTQTNQQPGIRQTKVALKHFLDILQCLRGMPAEQAGNQQRNQTDATIKPAKPNKQ